MHHLPPALGSRFCALDSNSRVGTGAHPKCPAAWCCPKHIAPSGVDGGEWSSPFSTQKQLPDAVGNFMYHLRVIMITLRKVWVG